MLVATPDNINGVLYCGSFLCCFLYRCFSEENIVPVFETRCYEFVKANMNAENVIRFLIQAKVHYEDKIVECCWKVID